jgi:hypothetical protein
MQKTVKEDLKESSVMASLIVKGYWSMICSSVFLFKARWLVMKNVAQFLSCRVISFR